VTVQHRGKSHGERPNSPLWWVDRRAVKSDKKTQGGRKKMGYVFQEYQGARCDCSGSIGITQEKRSVSSVNAVLLRLGFEKAAYLYTQRLPSHGRCRHLPVRAGKAAKKSEAQDQSKRVQNWWGWAQELAAVSKNSDAQKERFLRDFIKGAIQSRDRCLTVPLMRLATGRRGATSALLEIDFVGRWSLGLRGRKKRTEAAKGSQA